MNVEELLWIADAEAEVVSLVDLGEAIAAVRVDLGAQIHKYISSLTDFVGVNGTYNFTDPSISHNRGLTISSVYITEWKPSQSNWVKVSGAADKSAS